MAAKPGFFYYVAAAFNARPFGMFVAPNWVGVAAAGLLGVLNPGFWVVGAGLELGYLFLLSTNSRFQRTVAAAHLSAEPSEEDRSVLDAIAAEQRPRVLRVSHRALPIDSRPAAADGRHRHHGPRRAE